MNTELFNLEGKTAIVTGGANGIGKGCSMMLSDFGANVVVADLKLEDAQKAVDEIKEKGGKAIAVSCNVMKDADLTNLNRIYFENRSFSSSGSRCFLTHKRSLKNSGVVLIRC
nr:SDR family NAD(P)-dependent oxidoreductase [Myxosarcina sp. GI1]